MVTKPMPPEVQASRLAIVEEHVRCENAHDLDGVIQTFGDSARYDDEPWDQHYEGRDQVRQFYGQIMAALPDLNIEVLRQHIAADTIILEVVIRGTASWAHGGSSRNRQACRGQTLRCVHLQFR